MRHRKSGIKLSRTASHRKAMFRNMVTSLFKHDRIQTTEAKAKELRGWADHLITLAKRGDLHARRQALSIIREKDVVHKLFESAAKRFGSQAGGYTRIVKLGVRSGDAAPMSLVELVSLEPAAKKTKKKTVKRPKTAAPEKKAEKAAAPVEKEEAADAEKTAAEPAEAPEEPAAEASAPESEEAAPAEDGAEAEDEVKAEGGEQVVEDAPADESDKEKAKQKKEKKK